MQSSINSLQNPKSLVATTYDRIATDYTAWFAPRSSYPHKRPGRDIYLRELVGFLTYGAEILELGCGAGLTMLEMPYVEKGLKFTGVDISHNQLELAKKNVPVGTELLHADFGELTFINGRQFDAVMAFYSVIHLPREEQPELFKKIRGWLKPGGLLLVNLGVKDKQVKIEEDWRGFGGPMFWSGFDVEENRRMILEAGFEFMKQEVIEDDENGQIIPFLWVLARVRT